MSKALVTVGILLIAAGLLGRRIGKLGFGHLPGDVRIEGKAFTFYFPLTSCIIVSLLVTLLVWVFRR